MHIVADKPDRLASETTELGPYGWSPTFRYLSQTEVHVYALSIGASVLLSFFPFLIVILALLRNVLHIRSAEQALVFALQDYFPERSRRVHHQQPHEG